MQLLLKNQFPRAAVSSLPMGHYNPIEEGLRPSFYTEQAVEALSCEISFLGDGHGSPGDFSGVETRQTRPNGTHEEHGVEGEAECACSALKALRHRRHTHSTHSHTAAAAAAESSPASSRPFTRHPAPSVWQPAELETHRPPRVGGDSDGTWANVWLMKRLCVDGTRYTLW